MTLTGNICYYIKHFTYTQDFVVIVTLRLLGSALPLYTTMLVGGLVPITQNSTQPLLRPGWRQVAVHVYALPSTAVQ